MARINSNRIEGWKASAEELTQGTPVWPPDKFTHQKETSINNTTESQTELRQKVGRQIKTLLDHTGKFVAVLPIDEDNVGPRGGTSTQIRAVRKTKEGELEAVIINVYCDGTTYGKLQHDLEGYAHRLRLKKARKKEAKRLEKLLAKTPLEEL